MIEIQKIIKSFEGRIPGCAVMVIQDGAPVIIETIGVADMERGVPVTSSTNVRLASVSKHFTASAILELRERKRLSLSDSVGDFFPDFAEYGKGITIEQLLTHTSGLPDYEALLDKSDPYQIRDRDVVRLLARQDRGYFDAGSEFRYSNGGYCVLAVIVELVSGSSAAEFLRSELFVPLGMKNTFANDEGITRIPNRAYGYSRAGDAWMRTDQDATSATIGDGGVYSSLNDLLLWDCTLDERDFFEKRIWTGDADPPVYYGFGLFRKQYHGREVHYHGGGTIGFRTGYYRIPKERTTIFFLSNRNEGNGVVMCERIVDAMKLGH